MIRKPEIEIHTGGGHVWRGWAAIILLLSVWLAPAALVWMVLA